MIGIFVLAAIVAALTWLALAWPLRGTASVSSERAALAAQRDRLLRQLDELDIDRADQTMDAATADAEQARLEAELAQVLSELERAPAAPAEGQDKRGRAAALAVVLLLPMAAVVLYALTHRASLETFADLPRAERMLAEQQGMPPMVMEMVGRLEQRLAREPNDPEGWAQLGRSYAVLQRRADAEQAYAKAYALAPNNAEILADYAWLLYNTNPMQPSAQATALYRVLQAREPNNQDALWVLGLAAANEGNYDVAIRQWQRLLTMLPKDSQAEQGVRRAIAALKAKRKNSAAKGAP